MHPTSALASSFTWSSSICLNSVIATGWEVLLRFCSEEGSRVPNRETAIRRHGSQAKLNLMIFIFNSNPRFGDATPSDAVKIAHGISIVHLSMSDDFSSMSLIAFHLVICSFM